MERRGQSSPWDTIIDNWYALAPRRDGVRSRCQELEMEAKAALREALEHASPLNAQLLRELMAVRAQARLVASGVWSGDGLQDREQGRRGLASALLQGLATDNLRLQGRLEVSRGINDVFQRPEEIWWEDKDVEYFCARATFLVARVVEFTFPPPGGEVGENEAEEYVKVLQDKWFSHTATHVPARVAELVIELHSALNDLDLGVDCGKTIRGGYKEIGQAARRLLEMSTELNKAVYFRGVVRPAPLG